MAEVASSTLMIPWLEEEAQIATQLVDVSPLGEAVPVPVTVDALLDRNALRSSLARAPGASRGPVLGSRSVWVRPSTTARSRARGRAAPCLRIPAADEISGSAVAPRRFRAAGLAAPA